MGRALFALTLLATSLIQSSLSPSMQLLEVMPDFALVLLLIWSASYGVEEGLIWAFGLGLWLDFLTLSPLGSHAIPLLVVALVGGAVRGRFFRSGAILPIVAVVIATIGFDIVHAIVGLTDGREVGLLSTLRLAVITALLNSLVVPIAYLAILFFERWTPRRVS